MSVSSLKRLAIALGFVSVGLLIACGYLFWSNASMTIRIAFASEQTQIFEEMRTKALQSDVAGAAGCLEYVVNYYASGSKQETGSRLDIIVERERFHATHDIIAFLRVKTGDDLGESPAPWIKKFATR